ITANKKEQDDKLALPEKVSDIKMFLENINETNTENNDNRQDIQIPITYYKKISDTINQLQTYFTFRGLPNNILKLPNFPNPDWDILKLPQYINNSKSNQQMHHRTNRIYLTALDEHAINTDNSDQNSKKSEDEGLHADS
ncbi:1668_t:CDS:2, partial [Gigaspora rosea]